MEWLQRARSAALTITALVGLVSMTIALVAVIFDFSVVLFSTNSMSPTISRGDLTIVQRVRADEIRVGDILTVDRGDQPPVTHRVTDVGVGGSEAERSVSMQGDANRFPDAESYTVTSARRHVATFPGFAEPFFFVFRNPVLGGAIFVAVGALITSAFWPTNDHRGRGRCAGSAHRATSTV